MKKFFKYFLIMLIIGFIVIQFFQPEKNNEEISANHILNEETLPENIKSVLETACLDCHSNQTKYLWYHKIAPVSWMINRHIINGKDELNFSEWGEFDIFDKIGTLEEICQETKRETMPLKSYTFMHPKARLSEEKIAEICAWSEKLSEELLAASLKE